jgi:nitrogen-specific signal transduction histidine kinase/CheY-like chemotaxis protein
MSCVAHDVTKAKESAEQSLRAQRLESIGLLAGGIAHDLNNALAPVLMGVELLRTQGVAGNERILAQIETSAKRGAAMVRQLLGFARGAEGQRTLLDPRRTIREVEQLITRTFPKSIGLTITCPQNLNKIESDPTLLYQVLVNLCVNARDAMPDGGTLTLEVENCSIDESYAGFIPNARPGEYVLFKVSDTGTGIPPELQQKVFDPFFTTKPAGAGTGLGLTTVAGIAHNHGGFVRIQSEVGKGACFEVYFPVASASAVDTSAPRAPRFGLRGNGELILLVEDEEPVRLTLKGVLESLGFEVMATSEATEALALFVVHRERVKLVLTDERMPHMDGSTLARTLRHMSATVPIIVMSGLQPEKGREDAAGRRDPRYLQKPFSIEELADAVRDALGRGATLPGM